MTFGERIIESRKKLNLNQKQLAEILGITPTRLNYWENNKREPDITMIKNLSKALCVSTDYLIGNELGLLKRNEEKLLLEAFHRLNKEGQDRLVEFSEMLLSKDEYKANSKIPGSSSGETVRVFVAARSADNTPPKWVDMPKEEVDEIFNAPESDAEF